MNKFSNYSLFSLVDTLAMNFWVFVSSINSFNSASSNIVHFALTNYFVMTLNAPSTSSIDVYCSFGYKLYSGISNINTLSAFKTYLSSNNMQYNKVNQTGVNSRWFYTRCASSYDNGLTYLMTRTDGNTPTIQNSSLNREQLYTSVSNDSFFRMNYRSGDTITLNILYGSGASSSPLFIKNFYIFREYIPSDNYFQI